MPRVNRSKIYSGSDRQAFLITHRCVRRTRLCGRMPGGGRDYTYRKRWIRDRCRVLREAFSIQICTYAILSNHFHLVILSCPDQAAHWTETEIAARWLSLFPTAAMKRDSRDSPNTAEINAIATDAERVNVLRDRLVSVSWFMKCLAEPVARRANREDDVSGHFWEGRYDVRPLKDQFALIAAMVYVDLNEVRAGIADTPETGEFTGLSERIRIAGKRLKDRGQGAPCCDWLVPFPDRSPQPQKCQFWTEQNPKPKMPFLEVEFVAYLEVVDWSGRHLHRGRKSRISSAVPPIIEKLAIPGEHWIAIVSNFRKSFRFAAELPSRIVKKPMKTVHRRIAAVNKGGA